MFYCNTLRALAKEWNFRSIVGQIRGHKAAQFSAWSMQRSVTIEASEKPTGHRFPGMLTHGAPLSESFPVGITRLLGKKEIGVLRQLVASNNAHFLSLKDALDDGDLLAIQEPSSLALHSYYKTHSQDFLLGIGEESTTTQLLTASHQLKELNLKFLPAVSDVSLHLGADGNICVKIDPLLCVAPLHHPEKKRQLLYQDPLVGHCAELMRNLLKSELELKELDDLIAKASNGQWWRNLDELFLHPFFMSPQMHESFINNMHIIMYPPKQEDHEVMKKFDIEALEKLASLKQLAFALQAEWYRQPSPWEGDWISQCTWDVPEGWKTTQQNWPSKKKHKDGLVRQVRNLMHHTRSFENFKSAGVWGYRRDLFIPFMNQTYGISSILFHTYWNVKRGFEANHYHGNTSMWKSALASILPQANDTGY